MATEPQYPKRESHFAHKAVRAMVKTCVASDLGPEVFALLTVIAHTEDAAHYRRAVTFYNPILMPLAGIRSESALKRIREKAVKSGWLVYLPGNKYLPPRYWVTIPERAFGLDDNPSDEGEELGCDPPEPCQRPPEARSEPTGEPPGELRADFEGTQSELRTGSERPPFNPIPVPNPVPKNTPPKSPKEKTEVPLPPELNTPEFRDTWEEWTAFRKEIRKPLTERMVKGQFKFLAGIAISHGLVVAIERITYSIANGYQGLFPPDGKSNGKPKTDYNAPSKYDAPDAGNF